MGFGGGRHLFLVLFADSIIFVVFILKPDIIDGSICVSCSSPSPQAFICACVLLSLLSLCLQESIWYNICKCYSWPLMQKLDRIISLFCSSHNIIVSVSWLISSFWKGSLKKKKTPLYMYYISHSIWFSPISHSKKGWLLSNFWLCHLGRQWSLWERWNHNKSTITTHVPTDKIADSFT